MEILAHAGQPLRPHDLWTAWNLEPGLLLALSIPLAAYWRGSRRATASRAGDPRRWAFAGGMLAIVVALLSPLDALSGSLASAHMVQHVLLVLVAAPLLALSASLATLLRGTPRSVLRLATRWRRRLAVTPGTVRLLRDPSAAWVLHVGALWFWHAAVPYQAALRSSVVHVAEHVSFFATALLFWHAVIAARRGVERWTGIGLLLVFAMAVQSVLLSALLTFSTTPWYAAYATTAPLWGLSPLTDQQLAGVIMSVPAGFIYVAAGISMLVAWVRASEGGAAANPGPTPAHDGG